MQRVDLLRYQIEEINRAGLQPNEEEDWSPNARLANADRLAHDAAAAYAALLAATTSTPLAPQFQRSGRRLQCSSRSQLDPATRGISERATELLYLAEDLAWRSGHIEIPSMPILLGSRLSKSDSPRFGSCSASTARAWLTFSTMRAPLKKNWNG